MRIRAVAVTEACRDVREKRSYNPVNCHQVDKVNGSNDRCEKDNKPDKLKDPCVPDHVFLHEVLYMPVPGVIRPGRCSRRKPGLSPVQAE